MTITDLIKEGEEFRDSIGDSAHDIGKIQDSSKYHLWIERVVRYLGQNVPKDISIWNSATKSSFHYLTLVLAFVSYHASLAYPMVSSIA